MADSNLPYVLEGEYRDVYEVAAIGSGLMETDMDCRDRGKLASIIFFIYEKIGDTSEGVRLVDRCSC